MTKKRQPSVVSVIEEESLDLQNLDEDLEVDRDSVNYMNMDISTDNIEDIVTAKMGGKMNMDDMFMEDSTEEEVDDLDIPKGIAVDDPVRLYLREIGRIKFTRKIIRMNIV